MKVAIICVLFSLALIVESRSLRDERHDSDSRNFVDYRSARRLPPSRVRHRFFDKMNRGVDERNHMIFGQRRRGDERDDNMYGSRRRNQNRNRMVFGQRRRDYERNDDMYGSRRRNDDRNPMVFGLRRRGDERDDDMYSSRRRDDDRKHMMFGLRPLRRVRNHQMFDSRRRGDERLMMDEEVMNDDPETEQSSKGEVEMQEFEVLVVEVEEIHNPAGEQEVLEQLRQQMDSW